MYEKTPYLIYIYKLIILCYSLCFNTGCIESGVYGFDCNIPCPINCEQGVCNIQNGTCFECAHGSYGNSCDEKCPVNCKDKTCHINNGTCFSCESGWTGISCYTSNITFGILDKDRLCS